MEEVLESAAMDALMEFTYRVTYECIIDAYGMLHWSPAVPRCYVCECETATGTIERALCEPCRLRWKGGAVLYLSGLTRSPFLYVEPELAWRMC